MLVSSVQQSDSVIYVLFQMIFQYRLLQDIEYCFFLYSKFLLLIYLMYSGLHLLITHSSFVPPPPFPLW